MARETSTPSASKECRSSEERARARVRVIAQRTPAGAPRYTRGTARSPRGGVSFVTAAPDGRSAAPCGSLTTSGSRRWEVSVARWPTSVSEISTAAEFPPPIGLLAVPLVYRGAPAGVLAAVTGARGEALSSEVLHSFEALGVEVSLAITSARLLQQERESYRFLDRLREVGRSLSTTFDVDRIKQTLCEQSVTLLKADAAQFWDADPAAKAAKISTRWGADVGDEVGRAVAFEHTGHPIVRTFLDKTLSVAGTGDRERLVEERADDRVPGVLEGDGASHLVAHVGAPARRDLRGLRGGVGVPELRRVRFEQRDGLFAQRLLDTVDVEGRGERAADFAEPVEEAVRLALLLKEAGRGDGQGDLDAERFEGVQVLRGEGARARARDCAKNARGGAAVHEGHREKPERRREFRDGRARRQERGAVRVHSDVGEQEMGGLRREVADERVRDLHRRGVSAAFDEGDLGARQLARGEEPEDADVEVELRAQLVDGAGRDRGPHRPRAGRPVRPP